MTAGNVVSILTKRIMMKSRFFIGFISAVFITCILIIAVPAMAQEPIRGTQLALRGINADDAETAIDDESPKNSQPKAKELKKDNPPQSSPPATKEPKKDNPPQGSSLETKELKKDNVPQSLEQEVKELREEVQRIRNENEARKTLEVPEEEKSKTIEDILSAVGNQYTLLKQGTIALQYGLSYAYYSGDVYDQSTSGTSIERRSNHNLTNTINVQYALLNNLTLNAGVPFSYKYNLVGTASAQESTDLGDISLGFQVQPFKAGGNIPSTIFSIGISLPTGTSPYSVDPVRSLASGSGLYSISGGVSISKVIDPLVAFGNLSYSYSLPDDNLSQKWGTSNILTGVHPGNSIGLAFGFGYALSYQASLNLSAQFSYSFNSRYTLNNLTSYETGSSLGSNFSVGTGWRVTSTRSIYVSLGIGLTVNDPDVALSFTLPFEF
jgi:hypothetical protein